VSETALLTTEGLGVQFGGLRAVHQVSLTVRPGDFVGLIGPNGAGKTTVFNLITGTVRRTAGSIKFRNREIAGKRPDQIARLGISRTFQNIRLFTKMTALENVAIGLHRVPRYSIAAAFLRLPSVARSDREVREQAMSYLEQLGIARFAGDQAGGLPYGIQRKLEIARALATQPELLLLDEPAAGMNNEECLELNNLLRRIHRDSKLTVVLIEHHMDVVMEICSRIYVLQLGEVLAEGAPAEIQANPAVVQAYLGKRRQAQ
jgi:branched-chain amino acid transport system ATP-binding protein